MNKKFEVGCDYTATITNNDPKSNIIKYHFHCNFADNGEVSLLLREKEVEMPAFEVIYSTKFLKPQNIIRKIMIDKESGDEFVVFSLGYIGFNDQDKITLNACWDLDLD